MLSLLSDHQCQRQKKNPSASASASARVAHIQLASACSLQRIPFLSTDFCLQSLPPSVQCLLEKNSPVQPVRANTSGHCQIKCYQRVADSFVLFAASDRLFAKLVQKYAVFFFFFFFISPSSKSSYITTSEESSGTGTSRASALVFVQACNVARLLQSPKLSFSLSLSLFPSNLLSLFLSLLCTATVLVAQLCSSLGSSSVFCISSVLFLFLSFFRSFSVSVPASHIFLVFHCFSLSLPEQSLLCSLSFSPSFTLATPSAQLSFSFCRSPSGQDCHMQGSIVALCVSLYRFACRRLGPGLKQLTQLHQERYPSPIQNQQ